MSEPTVEVQGTLRADGTLELDTKPELAPGRVRVLLQPAEAQAEVIEVLHRIHAEQAARGHISRTREQIDADISAMRQEDEERMRQIEGLHEEYAGTRRRDESGGV